MCRKKGQLLSVCVNILHIQRGVVLMYDQHIILDFEMNRVSKINSQARATLKREVIEIGAVKLNSRRTSPDGWIFNYYSHG